MNDPRLTRLFGSSGDKCALQFWLLQLKTGGMVESRLLYGRALPYNFSNNEWSATGSDKFVKYDGFDAQVISMNLYCSTEKLVDIVKDLSNGDDLSNLNEKNALSFSRDKDKDRFGSYSLSSKLAFRPVSYLPMRNDYSRNGLKSVHGSAGAFSASLTNLDKNGLFRIGGIENKQLIKDSIEKLNSETGLDFLNSDATRLGDLEFLVFPTLDECERELFYVDLVKDDSIISISLDQAKYQIFDDFQFNITLLNNDNDIYSVVVSRSYVTGKKIEFKHQLPDYCRQIIDGIRVDVFAKRATDKDFFLYSQYSVGYIREIHINGQINTITGQVKSNWLTKHARSSDKDRVLQLETIKQKSTDIQSITGSRKEDPWVPVNRAIQKRLGEFRECVSDGRFFDQWQPGVGSGRIDFAEWYTKLIHTNESCHVYIFDPYFEDVGVSLLASNACLDTEYVIFTTRERQVKPESISIRKKVANKLCRWLDKRQFKKPTGQQRINNLMASCENLKPLLSRIKLKIYALPPTSGKKPAFHDRYILVLDGSGVPVKGFHLSNSIQKANENYPLLITPIPKDTLVDVVEYVDGVVGASQNDINEDTEFVGNKVNLIFDSVKYFSSSDKKTRYEPLAILEYEFAGDVLSAWLCEPSLKGSFSIELKEKLKDLGCIQGESLRGEKYQSLGHLEKLLSSSTTEDFKHLWFVAGSLFAHTPMGDSEKIFTDLISKEFIQKLFSYVLDEDNFEFDEEANMSDYSYLYSKDIKYFLKYMRGSYDYAGQMPVRVEWALFYAIKILWHADCSQAAGLLNEYLVSTSEAPTKYKNAICAQLISEIALNIEFGINESQIIELVNQSVPFAKWLGYCGLENAIEKTGNISLLSSSNILCESEKVQFLGWAINRSSYTMGEQPEFNKKYITKLLKVIPDQLSLVEFKVLVQSLQGRMDKSGWCEPWLHEYIVLPLLNQNRVDIDYICKVWVDELITTLISFMDGDDCVFSLKVEGQMTNYAAFYMAISSPHQFECSVNNLKKVLKKVDGLIKAPLSSTCNWKKWDASLKVALWIYGFTKWVDYYLVRPYKVNTGFEQLKIDSYQLAMYRQKNEWAAMAHSGSEFNIFLKERSDLDLKN